MNDKDDIKDLFQRELGNYEAKVDPGLWQGIQSGLSSGASAASSTFGLGVKVVVGVVSAAAISVVSIMIYNASNEETNKPKETEKNIVTVESTKESDKPEQSTKEINSASNEGMNNEEVVINDRNTTESKEKIEVNKVNFNSDNAESSEQIDKETATTSRLKETSEDEKSVDQKDNTDKVKEDAVEDKSKEKVKPALPELILEPSLSSQENQYVSFDLKSENIEEVIWSFGDGHISTDRKPEHFYDEAGTYEIKVTGRNGEREISKTINLSVYIEGEFINLPNAFSPNGDRNNDLLYVKSKGIEEFQITILNDEQKVVYKSNDINFKWDGTLNTGIPAPEGNYVYMIVAKDKQGNKINKYQRLRLSR